MEVPRVKYEKLASAVLSEASQEVRTRVETARNIQHKRFSGIGGPTNSEMKSRNIKTFCPLSEPCQQILKSAVYKYNLSARAYHRVIKLARTIADLAQEEFIKPDHLNEALQYRPQN